MPNPQNLIPNSERTPKRIKEITQKAGIASGKARRRKKSIQEFAKLFGNLAARDDLAEQLEANGVDRRDLTNNAAIVFAMFDKATQGDVNAAKLFAEWSSDAVAAQHDEETDLISAAFEKLGGNEDGE